MFRRYHRVSFIIYSYTLQVARMDDCPIASKRCNGRSMDADWVQALSRLNARESYDRAFRLRVGIQQSLLHRTLPKDQWIKPEDVGDVFFLIIRELMIVTGQTVSYADH